MELASARDVFDDLKPLFLGFFYSHFLCSLIVLHRIIFFSIKAFEHLHSLEIATLNAMVWNQIYFDESFSLFLTVDRATYCSRLLLLIRCSHWRL